MSPPTEGSFSDRSLPSAPENLLACRFTKDHTTNVKINQQCRKEKLTEIHFRDKVNQNHNNAIYEINSDLYSTEKKQEKREEKHYGKY